MRILSLFVFLVGLSLAWTVVNADPISFNNPLVDAADMGDKDKVLKLLNHGYSPDSKGDFGVTPLMRAAFRGNTQIAETLIKSGAYVNAADIGGDTPLHLAARSGNAEMVKLLLYYDAYIDMPDKEKWTPLMRAVMAKNDEVVKIFVDKGANLNATNDMDESVLVDAAIAGKPEIMEMILGSKGFADIPQEQKITAMQIADKRGNSDIYKMISSTMDLMKNKFADSSTGSNASDNMEVKIRDDIPEKSSNKFESAAAPTSKSTDSRYGSRRDTTTQSPALPPVEYNDPAPLPKVSSAPVEPIAPQKTAVAEDNTPPIKLSANNNQDEYVPDSPIDTLQKNLESDDGYWGFASQDTHYGTENQSTKSDAPTPVSKPMQPTQTAKNGPFYTMQLGAYSSIDQALFIWQNLEKKNPDLLNDMDPNLLHYKDENSGIDFYRLRIGSYKWKDIAQTSCSNLQSRNIDCFVVEGSNEQFPLLARSEKPAQYADNSQVNNNPAISSPYDASEPTQRMIRRPVPAIPQSADNDISAPATDMPVQEEANPNAPISIIPTPKPTVTERYYSSDENGDGQEQSAQNNTANDQQPIGDALPWLNEAPAATASAEPTQIPSAPSGQPNMNDFTYNQPQAQPQDYNKFYQNVGQQSQQKDKLSEAVLVKDNDQLPWLNQQGYQTDRRDNGIWIDISSFPNRASANDYADRMFRYDEDLSSLQVKLADTSSAYGPQVVMQVGPIQDYNLANNLCASIRSGGLNCAANGTPGGISSTQKRTPAHNEPAAPKVQQRPIADSKYWINLGTFSDKSEAEYYWTFLQEDNSDILNGTKYNLDNDVDNGEFSASAVKLKIGTYNEKYQADKICSIMRYRNIACLVEAKQ